LALLTVSTLCDTVKQVRQHETDGKRSVRERADGVDAFDLADQVSEVRGCVERSRLTSDSSGLKEDDMLGFGELRE
jgi:hypothetical protein